MLGHVHAGFTIICALYLIGDYFVATRQQIPNGITGDVEVVNGGQNYDAINNLDQVIVVQEDGKALEVSISPEVFLAIGIIHIVLTTVFVIGIEMATLVIVRGYRNLFVINGVLSIMYTIRDCGRALATDNDDLIGSMFGVAALTFACFWLGFWILNGVIRYVANERSTRNLILIITPEMDKKALV